MRTQGSWVRWQVCKSLSNSAPFDFKMKTKTTFVKLETAKIFPSFKMKKAASVVKLDGLSQNGRNVDQYIKM